MNRVISKIVNNEFLTIAEAELIEIAGSILQSNKSAASKILDAVVAKSAAATGAIGITGSEGISQAESVT